MPASPGHAAPPRRRQKGKGRWWQHSALVGAWMERAVLPALGQEYKTRSSPCPLARARECIPASVLVGILVAGLCVPRLQGFIRSGRVGRIDGAQRVVDNNLIVGLFFLVDETA